MSESNEANETSELTRLDLATTDELAAELCRRSEAIVVGLISTTNPHGISTYCQGRGVLLTGLVRMLHRDVARRVAYQSGGQS